MLFGQVATFWADTSGIIPTKEYNYITEAEWKINGQTLRYGLSPIAVPTDNVVDTIFYKQFENSKWDTLICNITEPANYIFQYNMCCGGFDVYNAENRISGAVIFIVENAKKKKQYLGQLAGTGVLVSQQTSDTLKPICWSPMQPNIYNLAFSEIEICQDTTTCDEEICLHEKGQEEINYVFSFKTISCKLNCLFLPLSNEPIKVIYNRKTKKIRFV